MKNTIKAIVALCGVTVFSNAVGVTPQHQCSQSTEVESKQNNQYQLLTLSNSLCLIATDAIGESRYTEIATELFEGSPTPLYEHRSAQTADGDFQYKALGQKVIIRNLSGLTQEFTLPVLLQDETILAISFNGDFSILTAVTNHRLLALKPDVASGELSVLSELKAFEGNTFTRFVGHETEHNNVFLMMTADGQQQLMAFSWQAQTATWESSELMLSNDSLSPFIIYTKDKTLVQLTTGSHVEQYEVDEYDWNQVQKQFVFSDSFSLNAQSERQLVANDDSVELYSGESIALDLLENDELVEMDASDLVITIDTEPRSGTAELDDNGTMTYQADDEFVGDVEYSYSISSEDEQVQDSAQVKVKVLNIKPVGVNDHFVMTNGDKVTLDVLKNDYDPNGNLNLRSVTTVTFTENGTLWPPDRSWYQYRYSADPGFVGEDSFTYHVEDNHGSRTPITTVRITVQAPVEVTPVEGTPVEVAPVPQTNDSSQNGGGGGSLYYLLVLLMFARVTRSQANK